MIFKFGVELEKLNEGCCCSSSSCDWGKQRQLLLLPLNLDLVCKFGVKFDKKSLFLVILEIGNNEVTDLHAHFFLLKPNHLLVAHQQLGFVVLQFSLKVHHLLLGISQVHFGITQDKIMC